MLGVFAGVVIGGLIAAVVFLLWRNRAETSSSKNNIQLLFDIQKDVGDLRSNLQQQVSDLSIQVHQQVQANTQFLQESQKGFHQTVNQVQDRLGQLHQATQSMMDIGKDISSLQNILKSPKLRGGLGELLLGELLYQILPEEHYALQYGFKSGAIVDAVIFLGQGIIPVDAKFPLENFKRLLEEPEALNQKIHRKAFDSDVKKHIDQIAAKYILPEENTYEFALMYIPAENVYYETIIKDDGPGESLATYALSKKVVPVSPNSFYAYLQAIVRGLKGLKIERSAQLILQSLGQLETDFIKCFADFEKTGTHLSNAVSAYDKAMKRFEKIHHKISSLDDVRKTDSPQILAAQDV